MPDSTAPSLTASGWLLSDDDTVFSRFAVPSMMPCLNPERSSVYIKAGLPAVIFHTKTIWRLFKQRTFILVLAFFFSWLQPASAENVTVTGTLEYQDGLQTVDWLHFRALSYGAVKIEAMINAPNHDRGWLVLAKYSERMSWLTDITLLDSHAREITAYSGEFMLQPGRWVIGYVPATTKPYPMPYLSPLNLPFLNFGGLQPDGVPHKIIVSGDIEGLEFWEGEWSRDFNVTYLKEPTLEISWFQRTEDSVWGLGWRAVKERVYKVQTSVDLRTWEDVSAKITLIPIHRNRVTSRRDGLP